MNSLSDDRIPLTHLSSKTKKQDSGVLVQPRIFKSSFFDKGGQVWEAPKPPPRTKSSDKAKQYRGKKEDNENTGDASSEDSTRTVTLHHRVVSAEVHSSKSRLLSSSEEDIATIKSKMSVFKSSKVRKSQKVSKVKTTATESNLDSETGTKTVRVHKMVAAEHDRILEGNVKENEVVNFPSQRRLSGGSYTLEKPTFPIKSQQVENDEIPTLPVIKTPVPLPRRNKSKESRLQNDDDIIVESTMTEVTTKEEVVTFQYKSDAGLGDRHTHRKKKKRKQHVKKEHCLTSDSDQNEIETVEMSVFKHSVEQQHEEELATTESQKQTPARSQTTLDEEITGITIHRSDCLIPDELVSHPVVRVHVIDMTTGEYLKKSDPKRPLIYQEENTVYILPMMTHPYDFRERRSVLPQWEELLVFNEKIEHIATTTTLLLFEIVDFVDFATASSQYKHLGSSSAWHCVAWAFLKLLGANGACNLNRELRLQLYKPKTTKKNMKTSSSPYSPVVYNWWCTGSDKYRGTMYVTIVPITASDLCLMPSLRSSVVLQREESSTSSVVGSDSVILSPKQDISSHDFKEIQEESEQEPEPELVTWSRLPSQSCKLPNKQLCTLPAGTAGGSMVVQFSHSGLCLASGTTAGNILVYTVPYWKLYMTLSSHQGLVYSVRWSKDDSMLISASADCTVCIWNIKLKTSAPINVLSHPSFVYCADFVSNIETHTAVITGCYDGVLRLWCEQKLVYEARGHTGFITIFCFYVDNAVMISGDSEGSIIMWKISDNCIEKLREITVRELKGTIINNVVTHPGGNRLLVHSRDSLLRMVDITTGAVIQWFQGCVNDHLQSGSCLTPCGGLVFACSEDGTLCVWDSNTSTQIAIYVGLFPAGCGAIHYHPHEHMAAVSSYAPGSYAQIILIGYDRSATGKDIRLKIMESSMSLHMLGVGKEEQGGTMSNIRKLFSDGEKPLRNIFTVSNPSTPVSNVPNVHSDVAVTYKKKSGKFKEIVLHKKGKELKTAVENVFSNNDALSTSSERRSVSKTKMLSDNDDDDDGRSTSLQTVKNVKVDSKIEDKRLRDIIRRIDRVLLAATMPPSKNT